MKKRKIKLFASIASLALVVAVMGVGVWAATSQAVKVNSTVKFVATGVNASIYLKAANGTGEGTNGIIKSATSTGDKDWTVDATENSGLGQLLKTFTLADVATSASDLSTTPTAEIAIEFQDGNGDGVINENTTFTYTFKIDNDTAVQSYYLITLGTQNPAVKAQITDSNLDTSLTGEKTEANQNKGTANADKQYGTLAASADGTIVITFTVTAPETTKAAITAVEGCTVAGETATSEEIAAYYNKINYSASLGGYYKIDAATAIASVQIEMRTTGTYVPAPTEPLGG